LWLVIFTNPLFNLPLNRAVNKANFNAVLRVVDERNSEHTSLERTASFHSLLPVQMQMKSADNFGKFLPIECKINVI
jgi:hypothetical protein